MTQYVGRDVSTAFFLYPDWWINENIALLEQRESITISNFPTPEIAASRIDAILQFGRTANLGKIKTPTMIICATDDFLTPPYYSRELAPLIPGAALVELERGGHVHQKPTRRPSMKPC